MSLTPGTRLGPYEILAPIGAGGMGEVYRARDTKLDRDVAIKVLPSALAQDPERLARFEREAKVLASLDHPNIGPIYGLVDSADSRALVLALIEGPTLADQIAAGPLPQPDAIAIAKQIIEALEYAHERGVVHRDLKPSNVKITHGGVTKVLDFGLAKVLEEEPSASSLANSPTLTLGHTRAGVILGTAAYMSPEQAIGRPVDRRSDVFSFGALFYEMLTGKRAFAGATTPDVLEAVVRKDPDWSKLPDDSPGSIHQLLRRCLIKDRKQRLQAIGEARIALENPGEPQVSVQAEGARHKILPWVVAAVGIVIALVLAFLHFREAQPEARVVSTTIPPPEAAPFDFGPSRNTPVLSPDGFRLVFSARSAEKTIDVQQWRPNQAPQQPLPFDLRLSPEIPSVQPENCAPAPLKHARFLSQNFEIKSKSIPGYDCISGFNLEPPRP